MKKYAIIASGGFGARMGTAIPKQFLTIHGKPILWYTLNTFLATYDDVDIILVLAEGHLKSGENILQSMNDRTRISLVTGGPNRFHSVKNGLEHTHHPSVIFVHDGVRCLVSSRLIERCYESAIKFGNAIPALSAVDSLRVETADGNEVISRDKVKIIQTPQTFQSDIIKAAYEQPFDEAFTDDASVVERLGIKINLVEGEETNIKITRPVDLLIAEKLLENRIHSNKSMG